MLTAVFNFENYIFVVEPLHESMLDIEHTLTSHLVVSDRFDNVLYDKSARFEDTLGKVRILKQDYDFNTHLITMNDVELFTVSVIKDKVITSNIVMYSLSAVGIALFMLLMLLNPLIKNIADGLDIPLNELLTAIEANKDGHLDYYIESHHFEEFDKIYKEFNALMMGTKTLMERNVELFETKREIEIRHLKNQFNPHFIYNTLESIRYEIMFNQSNASDMVLSLGRLMQYSITDMDRLVSVKEDMTYLEDYLILQKMRYKDRLNYKVEISPEVEALKFPKLLLQPIVENSIKHNMDWTRKLNLYITGRRVKDTIYFDVIDDGRGIEEKELEKIKHNLEKETFAKSNLGIFNIHRAIVLMYGENYGLNIQNTGMGLQVTLKLPVEDDKDVKSNHR